MSSSANDKRAPATRRRALVLRKFFRQLPSPVARLDAAQVHFAGSRSRSFCLFAFTVFSQNICPATAAPIHAFPAPTAHRSTQAETVDMQSQAHLCAPVRPATTVQRPRVRVQTDQPGRLS